MMPYTRQRPLGSSVRLAVIVSSVLVFSLGSMALVPATHGGGPPKVVRIGIVRSFFRDVPESQVGASMPAFQTLMQNQTGLPAELARPTDADSLADELLKDKVEFGIFQGVEFAWARQKRPELRPLVIAVNQHRNRHAHLMVREDLTPATFASLKGKVLAIPKRSREH
ncbi:MAG TPA: PhnD/SsuA/transferrin family substrate-binding protein, partial [Gemmataceae bacterium]|nr:PhnD/SsuA/transferrin family substrate-binding protein [Gemmataceae bacterium]